MSHLTPTNKGKPSHVRKRSKSSSRLPNKALMEALSDFGIQAKNSSSSFRGTPAAIASTSNQVATSQVPTITVSQSSCPYTRYMMAGDERELEPFLNADTLQAINKRREVYDRLKDSEPWQSMLRAPLSSRTATPVPSTSDTSDSKKKEPTDAQVQGWLHDVTRCRKYSHVLADLSTYLDRGRVKATDGGSREECEEAAELLVYFRDKLRANSRPSWERTSGWGSKPSTLASNIINAIRTGDISETRTLCSRTPEGQGTLFTQLQSVVDRIGGLEQFVQRRSAVHDKKTWLGGRSANRERYAEKIPVLLEGLLRSATAVNVLLRHAQDRHDTSITPMNGIGMGASTEDSASGSQAATPKRKA